ncbi:hypothetical protein ABZS66_59975 [Dactylosporangium sp. NPDC005572]|uniref:hypothetical protein n=1 Tax=Dactylosporangium sp. NPDC005572 TaxID=3156889 RepID=UPI0033B18CAC
MFVARVREGAVARFHLNDPDRRTELVNVEHGQPFRPQRQRLGDGKGVAWAIGVMRATRAGFQSLGDSNLTIQHNTMTIDDGAADNAVIAIGDEFAAPTAIVIEDNLLDGANFAISLSRATKVRISSNRFGRGCDVDVDVEERFLLVDAESRRPSRRSAPRSPASCPTTSRDSSRATRSRSAARPDRPIRPARLAGREADCGRRGRRRTGHRSAAGAFEKPELWSGKILDRGMLCCTPARRGMCRPSRSASATSGALDDIIFLAATVRAMFATSIDAICTGEPPLPPPHTVLVAVHWRAARDGLDRAGSRPASSVRAGPPGTYCAAFRFRATATGAARDLEIAADLLERHRRRGAGRPSFCLSDEILV